jgi:hypothetical protein
MILDDVRHG